MIAASSGHYGLFEAIRYKRHRQAMLLAEAGIDVNCRNDQGQTPLIYTVVAVDDCSRSRTKLVKLFLEAGADPNAADWRGLTALMHASILGQAETVKPLLESVWTNPCLADPNGNTALMYAASYGHHEVVSVFISVFRNDIKSLQLNKRNNDGFTALHLAVRNRHDICARILTKEAQFFPSAIEVFPDPKDLDREPTPSDMEMKLDKRHEIMHSEWKKKCSTSKSDGKNSTGTMTIDLDKSTDLTNDCTLSVLECSVGDLPVWNYTHPFGLQTNKSTQVISVERLREVLAEGLPECQENEELNEDIDEIDKPDEWPAIPMQLKSSSHKLLEPLIPIENANPLISNVYHRKCLKQTRNASGLRIKLRDTQKPSNHIKNNYTAEEVEKIVSGSAIRSLQLNRKRQSANNNEMVTNLLPIIPCTKDNASLPPVRYSLQRSASSKKETLCFQGAPFLSVRADQTPREIEIFKKNVVALS